MNLFSHEGLDSLVATYGYLAVALGVGLESRGLPIPGETILVVAAVYAATHAGLNIWLIVLSQHPSKSPPERKPPEPRA